MKKQYFLGLASGIALATVFSVNAAQSNSTIESCGSLLPEGHIFDMKISAIINTENALPDFDGSFSITDGVGTSTSIRQEQLEPFINCVVFIIK